MRPAAAQRRVARGVGVAVGVGVLGDLARAARETFA